MSRFGLRKRIKARLGRTGTSSSRQDEERFNIVFELPDGERHVVETEAHYTLHMASQMLETPIEIGCPDGHCGGCLVDVLVDEGVQPMKSKELGVIREKHNKEPGDNERLACHARLLGPGAEIRVRKVWSLEELRGE